MRQIEVASQRDLRGRIEDAPRKRSWSYWVRRSQWIAGILVWAACGTMEEGNLPPEVQDPKTIQTPAGALARYREALTELAVAFDGVMLGSGLLTDELTALRVPLGTSGVYTGLDSRTDLSSLGMSQSVRLHRLRAQAREARGFLRAYAPDSSPALQGHLYAVEGYAAIFLADLFCSGIPLSMVDFDGDYVTAAGSTTSEVYRHAAALFDSARTLTSDSVAFQHLAAVGRGRALLAVGQYAEAAAAVAGVPDGYKYQRAFTFSLSSSLTTSPDSAGLWFYGGTLQKFRTIPGAPSMADQEGGTGLNYRTSNDPRTKALQRTGTDPNGNALFFPEKYPLTSPVTFTIADAIEARLIEAEAALQIGDTATWRAKLNHLRQTAWPSIIPAVAGPLDTLADPGPDPEGGNRLRVDLLFRERAFWLYMTGHRQGDLRRLVRHYLRDPAAVYPTGNYQGTNGFYGENLVVPVPNDEQLRNEKYLGCFHTNA